MENLLLTYTKTEERDDGGRLLPVVRDRVIGEIENFIGLDPKAPYEIPKKPDLILDTESLKIDQCVDQLVSFLKI